MSQSAHQEDDQEQFSWFSEGKIRFIPSPKSMPLVLHEGDPPEFPPLCLSPPSSSPSLCPSEESVDWKVLQDRSDQKLRELGIRRMREYEEREALLATHEHQQFDKEQAAKTVPTQTGIVAAVWRMMTTIVQSCLPSGKDNVSESAGVYQWDKELPSKKE